MKKICRNIVKLLALSSFCKVVLNPFASWFQCNYFEKLNTESVPFQTFTHLGQLVRM